MGYRPHISHLRWSFCTQIIARKFIAISIFLLSFQSFCDVLIIGYCFALKTCFLLKLSNGFCWSSQTEIGKDLKWCKRKCKSRKENNFRRTTPHTLFPYYSKSLLTQVFLFIIGSYQKLQLCFKWWHDWAEPAKHTVVLVILSAVIDELYLFASCIEIKVNRSKCA
jgi:hypothetical protein